MWPTDTDETFQPFRHCLILGPTSVAQPIARELEKLGFSSKLQEALNASEGGWELPSTADPRALVQLRVLFSRFALEIRKQAEAAGEPLAFAPCVHPGSSPWAERPELPTIAREMGLNAICPPSQILALFGNKLNLLGEAERIGIPNLVLSFDPMHSVREIERLLVESRQQFPIVLKSVQGGGSFGISALYELEDLENKVPLWMEQLRRRTGDAIIFVERYLEGARQVTIPFARFPDGRFASFPAVDASLQSRNRKIVEFCPAEGVDPGIEKRVRGWVEKFAEHCRYVGVGSLDFLVESSRAYLIEGSARLNSGFHLWQQVAGTSAIEWQLKSIEAGRSTPLPFCQPSKEWNFGVGVRILAEDSLLQLPQPGIIREVSGKSRWAFPGARAELFSNLKEGDRIDSGSHGMLASLFVGGRDRRQALTISRGILHELWIAGSLQTNERFLSELLGHPWIGEGIFHAGFVDEEFSPPLRAPAEFVKIMGSVCAFHPEVVQLGRVANLSPGPPHESRSGIRWAAGDQWVTPDFNSVRWIDGPHFWTNKTGPGVSGTVEITDGQRLKLCASPIAGLPAGKWQVRLGAWSLLVRRMIAEPKALRRPRSLALISGRVHSLLYRPGSTVPAHSTFAIVESMGYLVPHASPVDFKITRWSVAADDCVAVGQDLAEIELSTTTH